MMSVITDVQIQHMNQMIVNTFVLIKYQKEVIIIIRQEKFLNNAILNVRFAFKKEETLIAIALNVMMVTLF